MEPLRSIIRQELSILSENKKKRPKGFIPVYDDIVVLRKYASELKQDNEKLKRFYTEVETVLYHDFNLETPEEKLLEIDKLLREYF